MIKHMKQMKMINDSLNLHLRFRRNNCRANRIALFCQLQHYHHILPHALVSPLFLPWARSQLHLLASSSSYTSSQCNRRLLRKGTAQQRTFKFLHIIPVQYSSFSSFPDVRKSILISEIDISESQVQGLESRVHGPQYRHPHLLFVCCVWSSVSFFRFFRTKCDLTLTLSSSACLSLSLSSSLYFIHYLSALNFSQAKNLF